jgi:hypothetical protein
MSATRAEVRFRPTAHPYFPWAARVDGSTLVLRINAFPDHPLYTLFAGGAFREHIDDPPEGWVFAYDDPLPGSDVRAALALVGEWIAFGSEIGDPCTGPHCCG